MEVLLEISCLFFLENEVKKKINTLRSYYSTELAKSNPKSGAGRDEIQESKWAHFNLLSFLRDTITPRKSISSLVSI